jgi:alpha-L-rhamnosidase
MQPCCLTCEYATDPLGIQTASPRFAWQLQSPQRGDRQTAYQVVVASTARRAAAGQGDLWDSGKSTSADSIEVSYAGVPLASRQRCFWSVRVWDARGQVSPWAPAASFELGLLSQDDWLAQWIGYPAGWAGRALYFRRDFKLPAAAASARVYVAGIGCHELRLNGRKVGDGVLEPAQTCYDKRVLYITHDVTALLRPGPNVIGAIVGNGWHGMAKLRLQMHVRHPGGKETVIRSTPGPFSWMVGVGPITHHGIYDGETYDARLEDDGWDTPAYATARARGMSWAMAQGVEPPGGQMVAQEIEPMRVLDTHEAASISRPRRGVYVLDMGQNLAGWARLRLRAKRGTQVTMRFAESLNDDGTVNQQNLYTARATDTYIARGGGMEGYEPRTTYHGFRYIQVDGLPAKPTKQTVVARVVRSAMDIRGRFACSSDILNRIHRAVVWTEAGNQHGVPTDCPQRAERMGWLNDLTARTEQAVYNFDLSRFYAKFSRDIADAQLPTGEVPDTVPLRWGFYPACPVSLAMVLIPRLVSQHWGNRRLLEECYQPMRNWVDCLVRLSEGGILKLSRWGDWSEPSGNPEKLGPAKSRRTPGELVSTAFLAQHARLLSRTAGRLGRRGDRLTYARLAQRVTTAFNRHFWDSRRGVYGTGSQACNALAVMFELASGPRALSAVEAIVRDVRARGEHLSTGNIATKYVLEVLSSHGHHDLACRVASASTYPSWGYMLSRGATTIWERWEHATGGAMNSHNHPMLGSVGAWFYRHVAGLRVADDAFGSDHFIIEPRPAGGITNASASLRTIRGPASVDWRLDGDAMRVEVEVPMGATAQVRLAGLDVSEGAQPLRGRLPQGIAQATVDGDATIVRIGGGKYSFVAAQPPVPSHRPRRRPAAMKV